MTAGVLIGSVLSDNAPLVLLTLLGAVPVVLIGRWLAARIRRDAGPLDEMSRKLVDAHERELQLERSRRELVAWVSHDLRGPLAWIRAMTDAIGDGVVDDPEDVQRYLNAIGAETDRLMLLVDDLFELSSSTSGATGLTPRPMEAEELVGRVVDAVRPSARARGIELVCDLGDGHLLLVSPGEATRVLRTLLDDAVRHTTTGGTIHVALTAEGTDAVVSVVDQCGGIPPADLDRVFDVAFRVDAAGGSAPDELGRGGPGPATATDLAEAHAGSISVSDHVDGCCVTVRFPLFLGEPLLTHSTLANTTSAHGAPVPSTAAPRPRDEVGG